MTDPLSGVKADSYDLVGNRLTSTDERRDDQLRLRRAVPCSQRQRSARRLDPVQLRRRRKWILTIDALGNGLAQVFDANNRVIRENNALGINKFFTYDVMCNLFTVTDENANKTTFAYDALDRLTSETNALGGVRRYEYDATGNRTKLTDENGKATALAYDKMTAGRRIPTPWAGCAVSSTTPAATTRAWSMSAAMQRRSPTTPTIV